LNKITRKNMKPSDLPENERTRCEVWTRVMGYHRPVSQFNAGKQSEQRQRVCFEESRIREKTAA